MHQTTKRGSGLIQIGKSFVRGTYLHDRAENGEGRCRIRLAAEDAIPLLCSQGKSEWLRLPGEVEWRVTYRGMLDQGSHLWLDFEGVIAKDARAATSRASGFWRQSRPRVRVHHTTAS